MEPQLRKFIARGGEAAWQGPSGFKNLKLSLFGVKADAALVHEMFTRYVSEPSQELGLAIDVRGTALKQVLLIVVDSERHQISEEHGPLPEGSHRERLFALVILGYRRSPKPRLVLFAPYVYASDTPGWRADREIYGYPRQHGGVEIQSDADDLPESIVVEASVIQQFKESALAGKRKFLSIVRKPNSAPAQPMGTPEEIASTIARYLDATHLEPLGPSAATVTPQPRLGVTAADLAFFERSGRGSGQRRADNGSTAAIGLADALMLGELPMLFLKQFRDVTWADRACYQAIVEASIQIGGKLRGTIGQDYVLALEDVDSVPIRRELGIPAGAQVDVDFAVHLEIERLSFGEAKVISNPDWNPAVEIPTADEPTRLPRYVDRGGEAVWRQPSLLFGARIYGFGVYVSSEQQQKTLNRHVNDVVRDSQSNYGSQPFQLRPCEGVEMVMLLFVDYQRITSGNRDDSKLGGVAYREFVATQLAICDDPEYPELDWFIPYICLDSDAPRLGGREIFGYPKQLGDVPPFKCYKKSGRDLDAAEELEFTTTVIRDATKGSVERGVTVVKVKGGSTAPSMTPYANAQEMVFDLWRESQSQSGTPASALGLLFPFFQFGSAASSLLGGPGVDIVNALVNGGIGDVFLKEFRDCRDPDRACYQAVCKTDTIPGRFHGGGRLDPSGYVITIEDLASEPLLSEVLGLGGSGPATMTPRFAYWLDIDLELSAGRVIANPIADDYPQSPDVSLTRVRSQEGAQRQRPRRRVARSTEPFWTR